jgi:hypothetical protein
MAFGNLANDWKVLLSNRNVGYGEAVCGSVPEHVPSRAMRLINTTTIKVEHFAPGSIPKYAIFSHT